MPNLLQGKPCAEALKAEIASKIAERKRAPSLIAIGFDEPAWNQYVGSLCKTALSVGVECKILTIEGNATPQSFFDAVSSASNSPEIDGIILQQPLPKAFAKAVEFVAPSKDIDCLSPLSVAKLYLGSSDVKYPATPKAVLELLDWYGVDIAGKRVVIVGRGNAVGKPLALMTLKRNATVTVCHTKTVNLPKVCREADVLVSACGVANLITPDFVTEKSVVIDVGLSFVDGKTCGDVAKETYDCCAAVSPVPGGVGPITRLALLGNLLS